jgi:hypothetical protein
VRIEDKAPRTIGLGREAGEAVQLESEPGLLQMCPGKLNKSYRDGTAKSVKSNYTLGPLGPGTCSAPRLALFDVFPLTAQLPRLYIRFLSPVVSHPVYVYVELIAGVTPTCIGQTTNRPLCSFVDSGDTWGTQPQVYHTHINRGFQRLRGLVLLCSRRFQLLSKYLP